MNVNAMAILQQHMKFKSNQIRLLFRDLQRLLELFGAM